MALAVCRRLFTAKVRVQSKANQCGICSGQKYTRTAFSPTVIPGMLHFCSFMYYRAVSVPWITISSSAILRYKFGCSCSRVQSQQLTHTHPSTPLKTPSGQTGWRKVIMWIIINDMRISAIPSQSSVTWKNVRWKLITKSLNLNLYWEKWANFTVNDRCRCLVYPAPMTQ